MSMSYEDLHQMSRYGFLIGNGMCDTMIFAGKRGTASFFKTYTIWETLTLPSTVSLHNDLFTRNWV